MKKRLARTALGLIFLAYAALAIGIPFAPAANDNAYSCTNVSSRRASPATISGQTSAELQNRGTATIYFAPGDVTVTATTTASYAVPQGQSKIITVTTGTTHFACIADTAGPHAASVSVGLGE
jgi:hypothetical protein